MEKDYNLQKPDTGEKGKQKESILSYLAQKNGQELQGVKAEIHSCQKEMEALQSEIGILEQTADQPDPFMTFALEQSRKTAENIEERMNLELAAIENEGRIISESHKNKIVELDAKMQKGIQYAYKIMNDMLEKPVQANEPAARPVEEKIVKKEEIENKPEEKTVPADAFYQEKQPIPATENVKIIEGFWEEPAMEEKPVIKADIPVQNNVSMLKNMYVIGKVAGEDLFDKSGKLIIARNEIITQEVIEKAEREGSLIELVLEMKLQEG